MIALNIISKYRCKVLHNLRFALSFARPLGRNDIIIGLDDLVDVINQSANLKQERIGIFKGNFL